MKKMMLLSALTFSSAHAMDISHQSSSTPLKIIIAAWVETEATRLQEFDEIRISKHTNGLHSVKHFSNPRGMKETRCGIKGVVEVPSVTEGTLNSLVVTLKEDHIDLLCEQITWYKHPIATHGLAVVVTMLLMKAAYL